MCHLTMWPYSGIMVGFSEVSLGGHWSQFSGRDNTQNVAEMAEVGAMYVQTKECQEASETGRETWKRSSPEL